MKPPRLPCGLPQGIALIIPQDWSAEQALAVFELLDDLQQQIWSHYQVQLVELLCGDDAAGQDHHSQSLPFEDPPF